jgi:hypothetical protein
MTLNMLISCVMLAIAFWIIFPRAFYFLNRWKSSRKNLDFSAAVFCFFVAFSFVSYVCIELVRKTLAIANSFSQWYVHLIVFVLISYIALYLLIPKTLVFFKKWRITGKLSHFILFILSASTLICVLSTAYCLYLPAILR